MADYTPISILRGNSTIIDSTPIVDGQILFDETRKCLFMDNGSTREKYSGLGADSNIANVEDTTTASQPYTTGEFVVVEGQLYKVTASIATGDTFSVGTNIETDTVGSEITKINNDLTPTLFREEAQDSGQEYTIIKMGKLVIIVFSAFTVNMTDHPDGLIASALPKPTRDIYVPAFSTQTTSNEYRIQVDTNGNLYIRKQSGARIDSNIPFVSGELIYVAN